MTLQTKIYGIIFDTSQGYRHIYIESRNNRRMSVSRRSRRTGLHIYQLKFWIMK